MNIYYKAVRPDGTDFRTGAVDYASLCGTGESLPVLPTKTYPQCFSGDVYHASTDKGEALFFGIWPCRLFEVEGDAVASGGNNMGFYTMKVVRELPAYEAFGPNGQEVAEFIEGLSYSSGAKPGSLIQCRTNLSAAPDTAWYARWIAGRQSAWNAAWNTGRHSSWYAAQDAVRDARWDAAAADAAGALVVKDLISAEVFDILYGPWNSVMD